jgi:hypothetical protein
MIGYTGYLQWNSLILSYTVPTAKRPDFGDVSKNVNGLFLVLQKFQIHSYILGYLTDAAEAHEKCSRRRVLIFLIKFAVLCDWHLTIIRPYFNIAYFLRI